MLAILSCRDLDQEVFATPRNRKPLILISNTQLPETKTAPGKLPFLVKNAVLVPTLYFWQS